MSDFGPAVAGALGSATLGPAGRLSSAQRSALLLLVLVTFASCAWGLQRLLPFTPDMDEPIFVDAALRVATTDTGNPGWFGNPGSTTIYPLALLARLWHLVTQRGQLFHADPNLATHFAANAWEYYWLGRLLSIAYHLAAVLMVFQLGRRTFDAWSGLGGAWLYVLSWLVVFHAKTVRTDSAATFFALLALYGCVRLLAQPALRWQLLAGAASGLAVASRYFLISLVASLLLVDGVLLWRQRTTSHRAALGAAMVAGLALIPLTFFLVTPYFVLDFATAARDLQVEARTTHAGADGLSPAGNLFWYLTTALPDAIGWPQLAAAGVGIVACLRRRHLPAWVLLAYAGVFLAGISLSALHWQRWLLPLLPCIALFAANGIALLTRWLHARWPAPRPQQTALFVAGLALVALLPAQATFMLTARQGNPSTRLLARNWLLAQLPPASRILQEWQGAPLAGAPFTVTEVFSVAIDNAANPPSLADYAAMADYDYVIVSAGVYARFFAEPERYPKEIDFYTKLFTQGKLVQRFQPDAWTGGPVIQVFEP